MWSSTGEAHPGNATQVDIPPWFLTWGGAEILVNHPEWQSAKVCSRVDIVCRGKKNAVGQWWAGILEPRVASEPAKRRSQLPFPNATQADQHFQYNGFRCFANIAFICQRKQMDPQKRNSKMQQRQKKT